MGRPLKDLSGYKFGRWEVLYRDPIAPRGQFTKTKWICRCSCGNERSLFAVNISAGTSTSCGCFQSEDIRRRNTRHGKYGTREYFNAIGARRRAVTIKATPKWASLEKIMEIYKNRPLGCDVDHIVPLVSKKVCGLHCEANLQYLTKYENQSKKNRYWPDMPDYRVGE